MQIDTRDFVAAQLKAGAPDAEWTASGVDRALELADIFIRAGITDISQLVISVREFVFDFPDIEQQGIIKGLVLVYNNREYGYLGEPDRAANGYQHTFRFGNYEDQRGIIRPIARLVDIPAVDGTMVAWSAAGKGNVSYHIVLRGGGFAFAPFWASSSDADRIRGVVKTIGIFSLSVVLPAAQINAAKAIGTAVMGAQAAAAYPALAVGIGNAAIGAAFNGGDIEEAAKGAILSSVGNFAGAQAGAYVAEASNIDALGKLTAAATRAYVTGQDIAQSVGFAALQNSAAIFDATTQAMAPAPTQESQAMFSEFGPYAPEFGGYQFDPGFLDQQSWFQLAPITPMDIANMPENLTLSDVLTPVLLEPLPDVADLPVSAAVIEPPVRVENPWTMADTRNLVQTVSQAALVALQFENARRAINAQVNTTARFTNPQTGQTTVAAEDGTIQTRAPDGQIVVTRPPINQPQVTMGGNVIINNGDGTYTRISPDGARRVFQYNPQQNSQESGGGGFDLSKLNPAYILAGTALVIALLRR